MPSKKAVGAAPLLTGLLLASQSGQAIVQSGPSLWSVPSFIGGCAAIAIGVGILLDRDTRSSEATDAAKSSRVALLGLAVLSFVAGTGLAIL